MRGPCRVTDLRRPYFVRHPPDCDQIRLVSPLGQHCRYVLSVHHHIMGERRTIRMTPYLTVQTLKPDLEAFLLAPIGEERNGMMLSVLSALNRLEVNLSAPGPRAQRV